MSKRPIVIVEDNGLLKAHGKLYDITVEMRAITDSMYASAQSIIASQQTEIGYLKSENERLRIIIAEAVEALK